MKIKKLFKRDTLLIILPILILTLVSINISYSYFVNIQSLTNKQEFQMGELLVEISSNNTVLNGSTQSNPLITVTELYPMTDANGTDDNIGHYASLKIKNTGTVETDYSVSITYDYDKMRTLTGYGNKTNEELKQELVSFDNLKIGIKDVTGTTSSWINFGLTPIVNFPIIGSLTPNTGELDVYPILKSATLLAANEEKSYRIYLWLDENTPFDQIDKYIYLKLIIKSAAGDETIKEEVEIGGE